jgi:hypothetical protein
MPKLRTCPCGNKFTPKNSLHKACCLEGSIEVAKTARKRLETKQAKVQRQEVRKAKERLKSRSDWIKDAQKAFNAYIRARDASLPCISCGSFTGKINAGHYRSTAAAPHLRFDPANVHKQCEKCNSYLSGNLVEYRINLIKKIGLQAVERLESDQTPRKWGVEELKSIRNEYRLKLKMIHTHDS